MNGDSHRERMGERDARRQLLDTISELRRELTAQRLKLEQTKREGISIALDYLRGPPVDDRSSGYDDRYDGWDWYPTVLAQHIEEHAGLRAKQDDEQAPVPSKP